MLPSRLVEGLDAVYIAIFIRQIEIDIVKLLNIQSNKK